MLRAGEFRSALRGTLRLARGHREGALLLPADPVGTINSFVVAPIVFLPWLATDWLGLVQEGFEIDPAYFFLVFTISFVIQWAAIPVLLHPVCQALDREVGFHRLTAAQNWASLVLVPAYAAVIVLRGGLVPPLVGELLLLGLGLFYIAFKVVIVRFTLGVTPGTALAIAAMCLFVLIFIDRLSTALLLNT